ncbi:MAG: hypothetical protein WCF85_21130 [Rhodospirillaceae bacterium]
MAIKFSRTSYGGVSFKRSGCTVRVFPIDEESFTARLGGAGWGLTLGGGSVHTGFASRRDAVEAVGRYIP